MAKKDFQIPTLEMLKDLLGTNHYQLWVTLCSYIEHKYEMDKIWNSGGHRWRYEYKYRKGGKTLCTLYAKENSLGVMIILGKYEREKFENKRDLFSNETQLLYDKATTYHDGKWTLFELDNNDLFNDIGLLLEIKRKPNR